MTARRKAASILPTPHTATKPRSLSAVVRVSKLNGRDGDGFISPDVQRETIEYWAKRNKVRIVSWHEEFDKSGKTNDREGLGEALDEIWAGESDGLIVARVDRYSRSQGESLLAIRELDAAGKAFVAVDSGIEPGMTATSTGWLLLSFLLMMAEWYLRQITENWLTARRYQVSNGIANHEPYGYERASRENPKPELRRRLVPKDGEAEWVLYMFERRAAGASWAGIAKELDASHVATPGGGEHWLWSRVRAIVHNRVYLGELSSCGDGPNEQYVNTEAHEPLVRQDLFDSANGRHSVVRKDSADYPLTGIVRCATCGNGMRGKSDRGYRYYHCRINYSWGRCDRPAKVTADALEALVVHEFFQRFASEVHQCQTVDGRDDALAAAQDTLDRAKAALQRFIDSPATDATAEDLGQDWYDSEIDKRLAKVAAAKRAFQALHNALIGFEIPDGLDEATWGGISVDEKRDLLSDAFGVIAVKPATSPSVNVAGRIRIWARDQADYPAGLPGRGATRAETITAKVPIDF